jgi:hypothetical protein
MPRIHKAIAAKCVQLSAVLACAVAISSIAKADLLPTLDSNTTIPTDTSTRYGLFNGLDHRSSYGVGIYPEPFLVDDTDLEVNEFRVDWLHTEVHGSPASDTVTGEVEKGFGNLTLEVEVPWEHSGDGGGMGNVSLGARHPLYEYVSDNNQIDTTFGVAIEVGIPTNSPVSKNTEVVPKIFGDLAVCENFTVQTILGYSTLFGGGDDGGIQTFEYGFVFGYALQHRVLPLPDVQQLIPVVEFQGYTQTNKDDAGHNVLMGDAGFRLNLKAIGRFQPRLGIVYVFPVDSGAREELRWGIDTSLVFEF